MIQLWFVSRALGLVALLLLSAVIALGVLHNTSLVKRTDAVLPRFVLVALHRNLSLIAVVFTVLHVVTVLVTPYLRLRWFDTLVPGTARYNTLAAALGTVAFDLVLALVATSLLRQRMSRRWWFVVHWTAYLCWPVAVAHAVVNASFRGGTWWTLVVPLAATGVVVGALGYRRRDRRRGALPLAERGAVSDEAVRATAEPATSGRARPVQPLRIVRPRETAPRGRHARN
jgi:sulfoxide reductase heme-binding subunit YedZ